MKKPKYLQIENDIIDKIGEGFYDGGFPTEEQLTKRYNCSRVTLRHALSDLRYMGYLDSRQGSGYTVVSKKRLTTPINVLSVSEYMKDKKLDLRNNVLDFRILPSSKTIANHLNILQGEKVFFVERLRYIQNKPAILEAKYYSAEKHSYFSYEALQNSIYREAEKHGMKVDHVDCTVIPMLPQDRIADQLLISKEKPVLKVITKSFLTNGDVFAYGEEYYNPEVYQLNFIFKSYTIS